jgi:hypothetical protein
MVCIFLMKSHTTEKRNFDFSFFLFLIVNVLGVGQVGMSNLLSGHSCPKENAMHIQHQQ